MAYHTLFNRALAMGAVAVVIGACGGGPQGQLPSQSASPPARTSASSSSTPTPAAVQVEGRIVFARWSLELAADEIFVIQANGSGERKLIPGAHECPRWAPDGSRVAMTGAMAPLFVDTVGTIVTQLDSPDVHLVLGCGTWSPDGRRYAAEGWDDANPSRTGIYSFNVADGGELTRLTTPPEGGWDTPGAYAPDGRQLAFVRDGNLHLVNADGTHERLLADGAFGVPDWSPDGRTLVVDREGALVLVPVDGSPTLQISHPDGIEVAFSPRWSPDGSFVAFSMDRPGPYADIWVISADGGRLVRVTRVPAVDNVVGSWVP